MDSLTSLVTADADVAVLRYVLAKDKSVAEVKKRSIGLEGEVELTNDSGGKVLLVWVRVIVYMKTKSRRI